MAFQRTAIIERYGDNGALIGYIQLTFDFDEEGKDWVGVCTELGTSAYADTLDQAYAELTEAVELQLSSVEQLGYIDEYLRQRNVRYIPAGERSTDRWRMAAGR